MKKIILSTMVAVLSSAATFALDEGFYRVQNNGSGRYMYVRDCTGDVSTLIDMGALELWPSLDNAISDPSSVMYLKKAPDGSGKFDITSQNTGVHAITSYYMSITEVNGFCMVSASGQYLYETGNGVFDDNMGIVDAKTSKEMPGKDNYRLWLTPKVDSSTDCYFGFKPTVTAGSKSYTSFFADFAYTPKSNNVKTWYVTKVDKTKGIAVVKEITGTVAKSQPVIIECAGTKTADNKVDLTTDAGTAAASNLLKGAYFCNAFRSTTKTHNGDPAIVKFDATTMRVLGTDTEGNLAFVSESNNLATDEYKLVTGTLIPHNTSYLTVDADCPATLKVMTEEEYNNQQTVTGDVNGDSKVNVADIQTINNDIASDPTNLRGDVNKDGKINVADIQTVCNIIANNN